MLINHTNKLLLPLILFLIIPDVTYSQEIDDAALALKKFGSAFKKQAGFDTSDEQVNVGTWFANFDSVRTEAASYLAILFADDKSMVTIIYSYD